MLLNRSAALLLIAIFGLSWAQASPVEGSSVQAQSGPISITEALSSISYTPLSFNSHDGPDSHGKEGYLRRFGVNIGRNYVLPFIISATNDTHGFTLEEKATIMVFITHSIQNLLTEFKINSDDLVYQLHTLIVRDDATTFQRLSGMIDHNHQNRFVDLLNVIEVHQSNIAAVQNLLKPYETIDAWRTSLQSTQMTEILKSLYEKLSSLSKSSETLWKEFNWILNM